MEIHVFIEGYLWRDSPGVGRGDLAHDVALAYPTLTGTLCPVPHVLAIAMAHRRPAKAFQSPCPKIRVVVWPSAATGVSAVTVQAGYGSMHFVAQPGPKEAARGLN